MLVFLKLGGSLITDKSKPHFARLETINRLLREVQESMEKNPELQILIGHGSGSFGHIPANKYSTRLGVNSAEGWKGFTRVYSEARALNQLFTRQMESLGLVYDCFPPSVLLTADARIPHLFNIAPMVKSLGERRTCVIYGDVVFDQTLHGSILSTEELFSWLAPLLKPDRILLAGQYTGVFEDFPANKKVYSCISKSQKLGNSISGSLHIDVTGGMLEKVILMQKTCCLLPDLTASIFSGEIPGNIQRALSGEKIGTLIA